MTDYGELMDQEKSLEPQAPVAPPAPESSPGVDYGALMDQGKAQEENALKAAIHVGAQKDPDQYAKIVDLSKRMSLPPDIVESQYDTLAVEQKRMFTPIDGVIKETPNAARWLTDPVNAALAMDDLSSLQKIETRIKDYGVLTNAIRGWISGSNTLGKNLFGGLSFVYDVVTPDIEESLPKRPVLTELGMSKANILMPDGSLKDIKEGELVPVEREKTWNQKVSETIRNNPLTESLAAVAEEYRPPEMNESITRHLKSGEYAEAARTAFVQFVTNSPNQAAILAGAMLNPAVGLSYAGLSTAGGEYSEYRDRGVDKKTALLGSTAKGAAEIFFEKYGTLGIFKRWESLIAKNYGKGVSKEFFAHFSKNMVASVLGEGTEEFLTEGAQSLTDHLLGTDPKALDGLLYRMLDAGIIGGFSGAAMTAPAGIASGLAKAGPDSSPNSDSTPPSSGPEGKVDPNVEQQQALPLPTPESLAKRHAFRMAQMARDLYLDLGKAIEQSKLKLRSPEKFQEAMQEITKETGVKKVYIPVETFISFFQSAAEKTQAPAPQGQVKKAANPEHEIFAKGPSAVANYLGVTESFETAKETTGGDIEIPLSVWVAKVHGAPEFEKLADDIKFNPKEDTVNQHIEEAKAIQEEMKAAADEAQAQAKAEEDRLHQANAEEVGRVMEQRIVAAGRSKQEAKAIGTLFKRSFGILAKKGNKDVLELFKRWGVNIVAPGESAQQTMIEIPSGVEAPTAAPTQPTEQKPFESPYTSMPGLNDREREIEDRFGKLLFETPVEEVDALYDAHPESMGGRILSADIVKDLSPDFQTKDQRMANSVAVHMPSSEWIWQRFIRDLKRKNAKGMVTLIGGGPGAGKTSSLVGTELGELANLSDIVFDQTLAIHKDAEEQIQLVLESGHGVVLGNVFRPIEKAVDGVAERMDKSGRTVPAKVIVEKAIQSQETFLKLWETYGPGGPKNTRLFHLIAIDNSGAFGKQRELFKIEELNKLRYTKAGESVEEAIQRLLPLAEERLKDAQNQIVQAKSRLELERQNFRGGQETRGEARSSEGEGVSGQREEGRPGLGEQPQLAQEVTADDIEQALIGMRADVAAAENTKGVTVDNQENEPGTRANYWQFSTYPSWYSELGLKNKKQFYKALETRSGPVWDRILSVAQEYARRGKAGQRYFQGAVPALVHPARRLSPLGFYSQLESEVSNMQFKVMPAADLANRIKNIQGIKADELETTGILDWLKLEEQKAKELQWNVTVFNEQGEAYREAGWPTEEAAKEDAQYYEKAPGFQGSVKVEYKPVRSGKVSKEEVLKFIQESGVKIEQVVLGEDYARDHDDSDDIPFVGDLTWDDGETVDASDVDPDGSLRSDSAYYSARDAYDDPENYPDAEEAINELKPEYTDEEGKVDEEGLRRAVIERLSEAYYESETEQIESGESIYSETIYTEELTDWTLRGNDERGWYNEQTNKHFDTSLEEAKVRLAAIMLEKGYVQGDITSLIKEDELTWREPKGVLPSEKTLKNKVLALIKKDHKRLEAKAREEEPWRFEGLETQEGEKEAIEEGVASMAQAEVLASYHNPDNRRNSITVYLNNPILTASLVGNNKKGWRFNYEQRRESSIPFKEFKLKANELEAAKAEAIQILKDKGIIKQPPKTEDGKPDVNAPTGRSKFHNYSKNRGDNYREILLTLPENKDMFTEGHWSQKNVLAHVRIYDTTDEKNRKVLFVDELQSDWHQKGRERGYKPSRDGLFKESFGIGETVFVRDEYLDDDPTRELPGKIISSAYSENEKTVEYQIEFSDGRVLPFVAHELKTRNQPDSYRKLNEMIANAPYKQTEAWASLAIKRIIKMAVEQGYDAVAFSPAEIHTERWGTDSISWVKRGDGESYAVHSKHAGVELDVKFNSREAAQEFIKEWVGENGNVSDYEIKELGPHWLVGSAEQRGGNANGMNIEELARQRGQLLERNGERVTNKEELAKVIAYTLGRERNDRSLESLTDSVWKQMQETQTGAKLPRAEGFQFFYDNLIPKKVLPAILKKLDKSAKVEVGKISDTPKFIDTWIMPLTPEIKAKVQEGFTLFQGARQNERLKRAEDLGFDTKTVYYHGTSYGNFNKFEKTNFPGIAGFFTKNKQLAADFSRARDFKGQKVKPKVYSVFLKTKSTFNYQNDEHLNRVLGQLSKDELKEIGRLMGEISHSDPSSLSGLFASPAPWSERRIIHEIREGDFQVLELPLVIEAIKKAGFDSMHLYEPGYGATVAVFSPDQIKSIDAQFNEGRSGDIYTQGNKSEAPRGQISFGIDGKATIQIFEKADFSTFIHESAHLFLEIMGELAQDPTSSQEIKDDFAKVLAWFGVESRNQIATEHHEQWARGFEAYLMEGKAPTPELRSLFARFKMWLIEVYRGITNLGVQLTPEVRGVMDRLLATQQEIERANQELKAEPMFDGTNLTPQQMEKYNAAVDAAKTYAEDQLTIKIMESYFKEQEAAYKDKKAELREKFEKQLNGDKLYRAIAIMQKGTMPDGSPLPEGVSQIKLDREIVMNTYGKEWVKGLPMRILAPKGEAGVHPDVAATLFGFGSGDEMLKQMREAPKKSERVEQLVAEALEKIFPDRMKDPGEFSAAALEAIHNDKKSELLKMELDYLLEMERPAFKGAIREVAKLPRRAPDLKAVREQARAIIAKIAIKDLSPSVYLRAEQRAAAEAGKLLAAGDIAGAFAAKRKQLFAHELYKITVETREEIDKSLKRFKRILKPDEKVAKTREMDLVNAARALLARVGLGKTEKTAEDYLEQTKNYDPDSYAVMIQLVLAVPQANTSFKELSVNDFTTVKDAVFALWELSGSTKEMEIDGRRVAKEEALDAIISRLEQVTVADKTQIHEQATTPSEEQRMGRAGVRSSLRRVAAWADAFDGGHVNGAFKTYIVNPVTDAINRYRKVKVGYLQRTLDILKTVEHTLDNKKIISKELKYDFTKSELLGALLHTGNESNFSKLLRGYGWGEVDESGNLDTSRWDKFIQRMWAEGVLTKEDYDFVQKVWDLNEELKPEAQRAHKKMYGYYFNEITARPVKTPFGEYRGGYVPAVLDPLKAQDAKLRSDKEMLEMNNNSFMFPTTGRGFTKQRVDAYADKLSLNLRMVPSHIDKVLRFIHIEPAVKMAGKIVTDKSFAAKLKLYDPAAISDMLIPWLQRSAQQKVVFGTSGWGGKSMDRWARLIRRNTGLQVMVGNVTNTLQQFVGFSLAAVKVKPRYLRNALWAYVRAPGEMAKMISQKSEFMDGRMSSMAFDLQKNIDEIILNPSKYERTVDFAIKHGYALQAASQNIVDTITWVAAYDQAIDRGLPEKQAIREADEAVRLTQGTFAAEDVSKYETGTPFVRMFTQFYSYFNMWANLLGTEYTKIIREETGLKQKAGRLLYLYIFGMMIPAVLSELIVKAMAGKFDEDDDDEYMDDFLWLFFGSQVRAVTAMAPFFGQLTNAAFGLATTSQSYDDKISLSPSISMLESGLKTLARPIAPMFGMKVGGDTRVVVKDALTTIGMLTSIPVAPLARPIGYMIDVNEGKAQPTGPIDYTRGLITGKPGARP